MDPLTMSMMVSAGGSLLGGLFGKKKGEAPATQVQGFAALPKEVQNAWLQTYLPQVLEQNKKTYEAPPMMRAPTQAGIFDSQGLADLQRYSDSIAPSGGLFPYKDPNAAPVAPPAPVAAAPAPVVGGGANGYDGSAKNGEIRTFTAENWVPGAPKPGTYIYRDGWRDITTGMMGQ